MIVLYWTFCTKPCQALPNCSNTFWVILAPIRWQFCPVQYTARSIRWDSVQRDQVSSNNPYCLLSVQQFTDFYQTWSDFWEVSHRSKDIIFGFLIFLIKWKQRWTWNVFYKAVNNFPLSFTGGELSRCSVKSYLREGVVELQLPAGRDRLQSFCFSSLSSKGKWLRRTFLTNFCFM